MTHQPGVYVPLRACFLVNIITSSGFQKICMFVHKENVLLKINANYPLF